MTPQRPPLLARAVLRLLLPGKIREFVRGDLDEEFEAVRIQAGHWRATTWYWRMTLASVWQSRRPRSRRTGRRSRRASPSDAPGQRARGDGPLPSLLRDLRNVARGLSRQPGFTLMVVGTLALCIGANTAVFSVVDAALLKPLPYPDGQRLALIFNSYDHDPTNRTSVAAGELADYQDRSRGFEAMAGMRERDVSLTGQGDPRRLLAIATSPEFFRVMGVSPAVGRGFASEEGDAPVAVLSHGLWVQLGSPPPGARLTLDGLPHEIVGVMPAGFRFPDVPGLYFPGRPDLWVPADYRGVRSESRGSQYLRVVARIKPSSTFAEAQADLVRIGEGFKEEFPRRYRESLGWSPVLVPLGEQAVGDAQPALVAVLLAGVLVLLIAGANVAGLMLVRGMRRHMDLAIRSALGASRWRLVRELLAEGAVLATLSGMTGIGAALVGIRALKALGPAAVPRLQEASLSPTVVLFALGASLLSALIFCLVPTLRVTGTRPGEGLARSSRRASIPVRGRQVLVTAQFGIAVVVLVGAGLLLRSFRKLMTLEPGYRVENTLTFGISLPRATYAEPTDRLDLVRGFRSALQAAPGAVAVGGVYPLPLSGEHWGQSFSVEDLDVEEGEPSPHAEANIVTSGYFSAMGIALREGRDFDDRDAFQGDGVAIVDEVLAEAWWPGETPIGRRISAGGDGSDWITIVGVVDHIRRGNPRDPGEGQLYFPYTQWPAFQLSFVIHTTGDPASMVPAARASMLRQDPLLPLAEIRSMEFLFADATAEARFTLLLISAFAVATLLLGALGVYGLMASSVASRTRELGIRLALGEEPGGLLGRILLEGLRVAVLGVGLGLALAVMGVRSIRTLLFGVDALDPFTFGSVTALLALVAGLAILPPALSATRVDPGRALRED